MANVMYLVLSLFGLMIASFVFVTTVRTAKLFINRLAKPSPPGLPRWALEQAWDEINHIEETQGLEASSPPPIFSGQPTNQEELFEAARHGGVTVVGKVNSKIEFLPIDPNHIPEDTKRRLMVRSVV